jgi:hypothetical protein
MAGNRIEPEVIIRKLLTNILVPPKLAKQALAGHFGVEPASVELTEDLLLTYGDACFRAGQERGKDEE